MVYSLAMAHYLGLNRYKEHDWERVREALLQAAPPGEKPVTAERVSTPVTPRQQPAEPVPQRTTPAAAPAPVARALQRRSSSSGYLKRR
ncbi:hypothetical protein D3C80_2024200 [compost metagenome]